MFYHLQPLSSKAATLLVYLFAGLSTCAEAATVLASSFGFNAVESTTALMNAINSPNDTIIVDLQDGPWNIGPLSFFDLNNKVIIFESGVVIQALPGAFDDAFACLFRFVNADHLQLIGYGAVFRMHRDEYAALNDSEYRHSISLWSCSNVIIKGLRLEESGGDGIAVDGNGGNYCENIWVEDVVCTRHYRQGMSIMNVQNMTVRHCHFSHTHGTLPEAGIDVEPYETTQRVVNLLIEQCRFEQNGWSGLALALFDMDGSSEPVSITVRDCAFKDNCRPENTYALSEIHASDDPAFPVQGEVLIERCMIESSNYGAFYTRKTADAYGITFRDCFFQHVSQLDDQFNEPIFLEVPDYSNPSQALGGLHFDRVLVHYSNNFAFFRVFGAPTLAGLEGVTGHFTVVEPFGNAPQYSEVPTFENVDFTYTNQTELPFTALSSEVLAPTAIECNGQQGVIKVTRASDQTDHPLGAAYTASGSATPGDDVHLLPGAIVIAADSSSAHVQLAARDDGVEEPTESVVLEFAESALFSVQSGSMAQILVEDCILLSIPDRVKPPQHTLFPNPTHGCFDILHHNGAQKMWRTSTVVIYGIHGHKLAEGNSQQLCVSDLPPGAYLVEITGVDGSKERHRLIKR